MASFDNHNNLHPLLNHLAKVESCLSKYSPAAFQTCLEHGPQDANRTDILSTSRGMRLISTYRPTDCCTKTTSATRTNPNLLKGLKYYSWDEGLWKRLPPSLSCEMYTSIMAAGASTLSFTGMGTLSSSVVSSSFSSCRT